MSFFVTIKFVFLYNKLMSKIVKRILIAEDSFEWQRFHSSLLKDYGKNDLEFIIVDNAKDALNKLQSSVSRPYDLIITDLQMETDFLPDFAGEWLVKQIKNLDEYKKTPVVIVSATYNIAFVAHTLGVKYLSKRSLVNNPDSYFLMLDENLL